jgi:hypothetical protein
MNPLKRLAQFFINIFSPKIKPDKISTPTTSTTQSVSLDTQIKQVEPVVEPVSEAVIPFYPIVTVRCGKDGLWTFSNGEKPTTELKPGYLHDTCSLIDSEDYPEINERGHDIANKLPNGPDYVLSISEKEFADKKCPKNKKEKILQQTGENIHNTGIPRNFYKTLEESAKASGRSFYLIVAESSPEIQRLGKKLLTELRAFGLHEPDNIFLAFAKLTKSTLITSDDRLIVSSVQAQCQSPISFHDFLEKLMQPSPITIVLRQRRDHYKNHKNSRRKNQ